MYIRARTSQVKYSRVWKKFDSSDSYSKGPRGPRGPVYTFPGYVGYQNPVKARKGRTNRKIVIIVIKDPKGGTERGGKLGLRGRVKLPGETRDPEGRMCLDILPVKDAPWVSFVRGSHSV